MPNRIRLGDTICKGSTVNVRNCNVLYVSDKLMIAQADVYVFPVIYFTRSWFPAGAGLIFFLIATVDIPSTYSEHCRETSLLLV